MARSSRVAGDAAKQFAVEITDYLIKLEKNLMLGSGRWVAEFNEAFRDFTVGRQVFDLYVRGGTRTKGLLLSRLFAYFSLPDYNVAVFVKHVPKDDFSFGELRKAVEDRAAKHNVKWTWLAMVRDGGFPDKLVKRVREFSKPQLAVSLVNTGEKDIETSDNMLGRKAMSLLRAFK